MDTAHNNQDCAWRRDEPPPFSLQGRQIGTFVTTKIVTRATVYYSTIQAVLLLCLTTLSQKSAILGQFANGSTKLAITVSALCSRSKGIPDCSAPPMDAHLI